MLEMSRASLRGLQASVGNQSISSTATDCQVQSFIKPVVKNLPYCWSRVLTRICREAVGDSGISKQVTVGMCQYESGNGWGQRCPGRGGMYNDALQGVQVQLGCEVDVRGGV